MTARCLGEGCGCPLMFDMKRRRFCASCEENASAPEVVVAPPPPPPANEPTPTDLKILRALYRAPHRRLTIAQLVKVADRSESTVKERLRFLRQRALVRAIGGTYTPTDTGRHLAWEMDLRRARRAA
jgi:hypothetical protein